MRRTTHKSGSACLQMLPPGPQSAFAFVARRRIEAELELRQSAKAPQPRRSLATTRVH
jgi:hypothetical protein